MELQNKRIIVTGGSGFLGSHVMEKLHTLGCRNIFVPRSKDYDLTQDAAILRLFEHCPADIVIHLAAVVGGIGANQQNPGSYFYKNLMMGAKLLEYARRFQVEKFVAIGTVCSYPKFCPVPFKEETIWDGFPEETNAPYGLAKKMMLVQSKAYREQYNFNSICLIPVNLYGPGDNFDLESSHVIPALIRKCITATREGLPEITIWGDGTASREFLYAEDAAEGIILGTMKYSGSDPVNLGTGSEVTIKNLVTMIAGLTGFTGNIVWDAARPNGQPRRCLDTTKAKKCFGFTAKTDLLTGLQRTIEWYKKKGTFPA